MFDRYEQSPEFATIALIAVTIRETLGDEVEACPGFRTPEEAEPLNRVFRAFARRLLEPIVLRGEDLADLVTWGLRQLVVRRLEAGGLGQLQIRTLCDLEPGVPDDWLTFLLLVPWTEIEYWLTADDEESA